MNYIKGDCYTDGRVQILILGRDETFSNVIFIGIRALSPSNEVMDITFAPIHKDALDQQRPILTHRNIPPNEEIIQDALAFHNQTCYTMSPGEIMAQVVKMVYYKAPRRPDGSVNFGYAFPCNPENN